MNDPLQKKIGILEPKRVPNAIICRGYANREIEQILAEFDLIGTI